MTQKEPELLVADSFHVRAHPESGEPEARNLHAHFARFKASAVDAWLSTSVQPPGGTRSDDASLALPVDSHTPERRRASQAIDAFLTDAQRQIAAFGVAWPRLELWCVPDTQQPVLTDRQLRLSLRTLPELGKTIEARTAKHSPVEHPERKGPNIVRYAQLNSELGAEALLTDERGNLLEGASTSLIWWNEETLCVTPDGGRVPSLTERLLRDFASVQGVPIRQEAVRPKDLTRSEVWAVNALHCIRIVTSIDGVALPAPDEDRLHKFRAALDASWQPVLPKAPRKET